MLSPGQFFWSGEFYLKETIMSISSVGNQISPGVAISDRFSTSAAPHPVAKSAAPIASDNPVVQTERVQKSASFEQVSKAVQEINKTIQAASQNLEFSVDTEENKVIVKVIDQQTKQVLRQIPTEEALDIAKSLDKLQGLLIKQIA